MKAHTNIPQSKKLAEILPIESADMWYCPYPNDADWYDKPNIGKAELLLNQLPCWSISALLAAIPIEHNLHGYLTENGMVYRVETLYAGNSKNYDNPVDACVAMIEKLNEQNLL